MASNMNCKTIPQDQLFKSFTSISTSRSDFVYKYLTEGHGAILAAQKTNSVSMEGVASVRFGLAMVAELMQKEIMESSKLFADTSGILKATKCLCTETTINKCDLPGITGPCIYLMKLIYRQYGHTCLIKVADKYPWIIPKPLQNYKVI